MEGVRVQSMSNLGFGGLRLRPDMNMLGAYQDTCLARNHDSLRSAPRRRECGSDSLHRGCVLRCMGVAVNDVYINPTKIVTKLRQGSSKCVKETLGSHEPQHQPNVRGTVAKDGQASWR